MNNTENKMTILNMLSVTEINNTEHEMTILKNAFKIQKMR